MRDWTRLTKAERARYMQLQTAPRMGATPYLPDGYTDCGACSTPTRGRLCIYCSEELMTLEDKLRGRL